MADEKQLRPRETGLLRIFSALDERAPVLLGFGAVLGIVREGQLIAHDNSIEFFVRNEHAQIHEETVHQLVESGEFVRIESNEFKMKGREKIVLKRGNVTYKILIWRRRGHYRVWKYLRLPEEMFVGEPLPFSGSSVMVPSPVHEYLKWQYLDWETPVAADEYKWDLGYNGRKSLRSPRTWLLARAFVGSTSARLGFSSIASRIKP